MRRTGRSTEGVRLMVLGDDDQVSGIASVVEQEDADLPEELEEPGAPATAPAEDAPDAP